MYDQSWSNDFVAVSANVSTATATTATTTTTSAVPSTTVPSPPTRTTAFLQAIRSTLVVCRSAGSPMCL